MALRIEPEIGGCMVVLLGQFAPLMFSPLWFAKNNIVSSDTADAALIGILHQDLAQLRIGKFQLQVQVGRLQAETTEAPWVDLSDFVARTFTEALLATPINQMGINRIVHFSVGSEEIRDRIGKTLAPNEPWGEFGRAIAATKSAGRGGCIDVTMYLPTSGDGFKGHMQVSVQPSARIKGNIGIYVQTNDHYDVGKLEEITDCTAIMKLLIDNFEKSVQFSDSIIDHLMSLAAAT
jgi:hypothetical protein